MGEELTEPGGGVRLFVEAPLDAAARVELNEGQAHYLLHVMRAKVGDRLALFNGRDGEWRARIVEVRKRGCVLECEARTVPLREVPDLWLVFAPIKKTPEGTRRRPRNSQKNLNPFESTRPSSSWLRLPAKAWHPKRDGECRS